jgi:hypothetical protein
MDISKYQDHFVIPRDKIKKNSSAVGQAVYDNLRKAPVMMSVEEILDQFQHDYVQKMEETIKDNINKYDAPFYIVVLTKKEHWSELVMRNWFVARQTKPTPRFLRTEFPNHMHTVYSFDKNKEEMKLLWNLPTRQDAGTVLKNPHLYDSALVKWIQDYDKGRLFEASENV